MLSTVCTPITPSSPVIATFAGASPTAFADWGTAALVGGTYVFPACTTTPPEPASPLFGDYSANAWTISGTVGDFSGFGIWWDLQSGTTNGNPTYSSGLIDASAYAGIRFDISGNAGPLGVVTFGPLSANQQSPSTDPPTCGTCNRDAGPCNVPSTYAVSDLANTPKTVEVRWADLASSAQPFDPAKLAIILWYFPWTRGATPYPVDVTIANVQFLVAATGDGGAD